MERPAVKTYEFKGSRGPNIILLALIGAAVAAALYMLLVLLTKLSALPSGFIGKAAFGGVVIGIIVALIMKFAREWSFIATYLCVASAIILPSMLINSISKALPLQSNAFTVATRGLVIAYALYVIAMIIMKIATRQRLVIGEDGSLRHYYGRKPGHNFNLGEYKNRIECTYRSLNIHSPEEGNRVKYTVDIRNFSSAERWQIDGLVERFAGKYQDDVYLKISENTFFPKGWMDRAEADAAYRDEIYTLISKTYKWSTYPFLRNAMELIAANGHVKAMYDIGMYYFDDKTIKKGYSGPKIDGLNWLRKAADHGSTDAAYELGEYYHTHWNQGHSEGTAAVYYKQAMKDPKYKETAALGLKYSNSVLADQYRERAAAAGGYARTKAEIDSQIAATALKYDLHADAVAYSDNMSDEAKAMTLGAMAGLEINEIRALRAERKNARDD